MIEIDLFGLAICALIATVIVASVFFLVVKAYEVAKLMILTLFKILDWIRRR